MIRCQGLFKCMAACEVLPWHDCRGTSNTMTNPRHVRRPSHPNLLLFFKGLDLNSARSIWVSNTKSFHSVFSLLKGSQTFLQSSSSCKAWRAWEVFWGPCGLGGLTCSQWTLQDPPRRVPGKTSQPPQVGSLPCKATSTGCKENSFWFRAHRGSTATVAVPRRD